MRKSLVIISIIVLVILAIIIGVYYYALNSGTEPLINIKFCESNSDCVVFGKTGECNCGCYNKDTLPTNSGGACFCQAPTDCECVNNKCEGVFE